MQSCLFNLSRLFYYTNIIIIKPKNYYECFKLKVKNICSNKLSIVFLCFTLFLSELETLFILTKVFIWTLVAVTTF